MKTGVTTQVDRMLRALANNVDIVCEGLEGAVYPGDAKRNARIDALVAAGALRADDQSSYLLNPRLRAFLEDQLGKFQAFSALTTIDPYLTQLSHHRLTLRQLRSTGEHDDAQLVEAQMVAIVADIAYDIDRNLLVLNSNLSSDYGNVASINTKVLQNDFYLRGVKRMLESLVKLRHTAQDVQADAVAMGAVDLEGSVRRGLLGRLLSWSQQLNQAHHTVSSRLFLARKRHERLSRLSRVALWLQQRGALAETREVDVAEGADLRLWAPVATPVRLHIDPADSEDQVQSALARMVAALPIRSAEARMAQAPVSEEVTCVADDEDDFDTLAGVPAHEQSLLQMLDAAHASPVPLSMVQWFRNSGLDLAEEDWLLYAPSHAKASDLEIDYVIVQLADNAGRLNEHFSDVLVWSPALAAPRGRAHTGVAAA